MSRVLVPETGFWYHELRAVNYYVEDEIERAIHQHVAQLFPDYFVFPFKKDVTHQCTGDTRKPDLGMVRRDLSSWGIIEVELYGHDIDHVVRQTDCFANGDYNAPQMAEYIRRKLRLHHRQSVELVRLTSLLQKNAPLVLVVVDNEQAAWLDALRAVPADLCTFQVYKNTRGQHLYRVLGNYPIIADQEAHCRPHKTLANLLEVVGTFEFKKVGKKKQITVYFNDTVTRWTLIDDGRKRFLRFFGASNPLSPNANYVLLADQRNKYFFRVN